MGLFSEDVRDEFRGIFGNLALQVLIDNFEFETVLDIGSGEGLHADILSRHGRDVTALDLGRSVYYDRRSEGDVVPITGNYCDTIFHFPERFDCIWASHVLEHQVNPGTFLRKINTDLKEGGVLAITVPPLKHKIVGGHVSLWNAGLLLYHLVLAGFDCRDAHVCQYGYNISVILRKRSIELPTLDYDSGDINRLAQFLPLGASEGFNGNIAQLNWPFGK